MAIENKYVNSDVAAGNLSPSVSGGAELVTMIETFEVAAADDNGSVYRVFKGLDASLVLVNALISNDAMTGSTDWDLGLYESDLGAVCVKDCFLDGADLSSAHARGSDVSGVSKVDPANIKTALFERAGHTVATKKAAYDLALTANAVGSAAGTVSIIATFART